MTPEQAVSALDRALARHGQDVLLQRPIGTNQGFVSAKCRAQVLGYQPADLIAGSGITQGDSRVILSPTDIEAAQWPGAYVLSPTTQGDQRVPRKGDRVLIAGRTRNVEAAAPRYIDGVLVRIELQVKG